MVLHAEQRTYDFVSLAEEAYLLTIAVKVQLTKLSRRMSSIPQQLLLSFPLYCLHWKGPCELLLLHSKALAVHRYGSAKT